MKESVKPQRSSETAQASPTHWGDECSSGLSRGRAGITTTGTSRGPLWPAALLPSILWKFCRGFSGRHFLRLSSSGITVARLCAWLVAGALSTTCGSRLICSFPGGHCLSSFCGIYGDYLVAARSCRSPCDHRMTAWRARGLMPSTWELCSIFTRTKVRRTIESGSLVIIGRRGRRPGPDPCCRTVSSSFARSFRPSASVRCPGVLSLCLLRL